MGPACELLAKLISIPSVNPMGQNVSGPIYYETALSQYLEDWLRRLPVEIRRQPVRPGRENVVATYHSPSSRKSVLFEVHQDTVPVTGMEIEPFEGKLEGTRMYGRGACDDKGPMVAMLLALERLAREQPVGAPSLTLALTVDEEFTFTGVTELIRQNVRADVAIVAEPTELEIVVAHKGAVRWEVVSHGRACHSSAPTQGINAIYRMAPVLSALEKYAEIVHRQPAHPLVGSPTLSVGVVAGGVSVNTVPDRCRIEIDRRLLPGEDPDRAYDDANQFVRSAPGVDASTEYVRPWLRSLAMGNEINGPLAERFGRSIVAVRGSSRQLGVPFGTDASKLNAAGIPTIVFGPGSIAQAHTKDEWIDVTQIDAAVEILYHFLTREMM